MNLTNNSTDTGDKIIISTETAVMHFESREETEECTNFWPYDLIIKSGPIGSDSYFWAFITIYPDRIGGIESDGLLSAKLRLRSKPDASGYFFIDGVKYISESEKTYEIDVTSLLNSSAGVKELKITTPNLNDGVLYSIEFYTTGDYAPQLILEYENLTVKDGATFSAEPACGIDPFDETVKYKSYSLPDGVVVFYRLTDGSTITTVSDFDGLFGFNLSHVYRKGNTTNTGFGNGMSLNVCEKLVEEQSTLYYYDFLGDKYRIVNGMAKNLFYSSSVSSTIEALFKNVILKGISGSEYALKAPSQCLTDGNITKGFNIYGQLVFICDNYRRYIHIIYNESGYISQINFYKGDRGTGTTTVNLLNEYTFAYSGNYLRSISKDGSTTVSYAYTGGYLTGTSRSDGVNITFADTYSSITASDGYGIYLNYGTAVTLSVKSLLTKIPDGSVNPSAPEIARWTFSKTSVYTKITDKDEISVYYNLNSDGTLKYYSEETNGLISYAEMYSVDSYGRRILSKAKREALNKYAYNNFPSVFYDNEKITTTVNSYKQAELVSYEGIKLNTLVTFDYDVDYVYDRTTHLCTQIVTYYTFNKNEIGAQSYTHYTDLEYSSEGMLTKKTTYISEEYSYKGKTVEEYEYDSNGNAVKVTTYNTLSPTVKYIAEKTFDSRGNVASQKDECGLYSVRYEYNNDDALVHFTLPGNYNRYYNYNTVKQLESVVNGGPAVTSTNELSYGSGEVTEYKCGTQTIGVKYDEKRRISQTLLNGSTYETFTYERVVDSGNACDAVTMTNANGEKFKVTVAKTGLEERAYYGGNLLTDKKYNGFGQVTSVTDGVTGETRTYGYDKLGNISSYSDTDGDYTETYQYSTIGCLWRVISETGGEQERFVQYDYSRDSERRLNGMYIDDYEVSYRYDTYGRYIGKYILIDDWYFEYEQIIYRTYNSTHITSQIEQINYYGNVFLKYTYDMAGNISCVQNESGTTVKYTYDSTGRLYREDNGFLGKTYLYSYDSNGNILTRGEAAYTTAGTVTAETTVNYVYVDGKLTSYNGQSCAYDMVGNPTTYRGKTAVWTRGRKLSSYNGNTFTYDGEGRRRTKNGITYYYDGQGRLVRQSNGLSYYYDSTGLVMFKYNGSNYAYRKDAQGNIIAIIDNSRNVVVEYKYDAWGNHTVTGSNTALGNLNPFRYRGYYYDTETGLYYLQTRYYDPEVGRFLNMDSIDYADPESLDGLNLYAYCGNNPVMYSDPTGKFFLSLLVAAIAGAAVSATVSIGVQLATSETVNWGQVGISALFGAVGGMLSFTGIGGVIGQFFIQGTLAVGEIYSIAALNGTVSSIGFSQVAATFLFAGAVGAIGGKGGTSEFKRIGQIEANFLKYTARDVQRYGASLVGTILNRGAKYIGEFVKPLFKQTIITGLVNGIANISDFWIQTLYDNFH